MNELAVWMISGFRRTRASVPVGLNATLNLVRWMVKRALRGFRVMSAFDPKRTFAPQLMDGGSNEALVACDVLGRVQPYRRLWKSRR